VYNLKPIRQTFKDKEIEVFCYPSRWEIYVAPKRR